MSDVNFEKKEFIAFKKRVKKVVDVCAGEDVVKSGKTTYLPMPNPKDVSRQNLARYDQYLDRAIFYNATGQTKKGLVGAAFTKDPKCDLVTSLDYLKTDVDGAGISIYQQSQKAAGAVLEKGRHALFVDYPTTEGATTRAEMQTKNIRASIFSVDAFRVRNWKTITIGGKQLLSLVVIDEVTEIDTPDGFGTETKDRRRVLKLTQLESGNRIYEVEIWENVTQWVKINNYFPVDGKGKYWEEIPFIFIGAQNNDPEIDDSPLLDMAVINIGHYRNSADHEDSVFYTGQVQPWASGVSQGHYEFMKKEEILIGSRTLLPLPDGGTFGFAQAQPNTLVSEAMKTKEQQMISLGARLVTPGSAVKTATEAQSDNEAEHSVLSLVVSNVSDAYDKCLQWVGLFMNVQGENVYTINKDFTEMKLDATLITALNTLFQGGNYPKSDLWDVLRRMRAIQPDKSDEDIQEELDANPPALDLDDDPKLDKTTPPPKKEVKKPDGG